MTHYKATIVGFMKSTLLKIMAKVAIFSIKNTKQKWKALLMKMHKKRRILGKS